MLSKLESHVLGTTDPCQLSGTTQGFDAHLANSGHTFDFSSCLGETNMTKSVYIYIYIYILF